MKWLVQLFFKFDDEEYAEVSKIRKEAVLRYRRHPMFILGMLVFLLSCFYIFLNSSGILKYTPLALAFGLSAIVDTLSAEYCRKILELKKSMVQK